MALASVTIDYDIADLVGTDFDARRTKVYATTNVPGETVVDTVGNKIRIGDGVGTIAADGTGSISLWVPGAGSNPASWQTTIHVDYAQRRPGGKRETRSFGPFTITTAGDLADLIAEQEIPPTYVSTVTALLNGYVDDAKAARTGAQNAETGAEAALAAAQALVISDLGTTDGQTRALVEAQASQTARALASAFAATGRSVSRPNRDLRSILGDRLIVGGNVVPTPTQVAQGAPTWALMWKGIVEDDGTRQWVADQIDYLAGSGVAGNAVRVIGAAGHISLGTYFTRDEYLAAVEWFCDYATSKGLMVYPSLIGDWRDFSADFTPIYPDLAAKADLLAVMRFYDTYGSVIGVDLCNEYFGHPPTGKTGFDNFFELQAWIETMIRPAGVSVPVTASLAVFDAANLAGSGSYEADVFDFLDRHIYFNAGVPLATQIASLSGLLRARAKTDTPILIGEANIGQSLFSTATDADKAAYIDALGQLCAHPRVLGYLVWAIADQGTTVDLKYGLYSGLPGATPVPRAPQSAAVKRAPRRRQGQGITRFLNAPLSATENTTTDIILNGTIQDVGGFERGGGNAFITITEAGVYTATLTINFSNSDATAAYDCWAYIPNPNTGDRDNRIVSMRGDRLEASNTCTITKLFDADTQIAAAIYYSNVDGGGPAAFMEGATRTFLSVARVG